MNSFPAKLTQKGQEKKKKIKKLSDSTHESYLFQVNIKRSQENKKIKVKAEERGKKKLAKREGPITQKGSGIRTKS